MDIKDSILKLESDEIPWRLFMPEKPRKDFCVLWLQGWSSSMDSHLEGVKRMVKASGIPFATLDPAGHGQHKLPIEDSTRRQQHEETIAVFDELKKLGFQKIIVIGGSFGGYMAALLTSKRPVQALVLRAPANYLDAEFDLAYSLTSDSQDYAKYTSQKPAEEMFKTSLATKAIKEFDGFVYILEHELDEVVDREIPRSYFKVAKYGNYLVVPKTKHSPKVMKNPEKHFDYIERLIEAIIKAIELQDSL